MSEGREHSVTEAFVSLASTLVGTFDVVDVLNQLTERCTALLDVGSAGLLLADRAGVLHVVAASSEETRALEVFQLQRDEGPCLECYRRGTAIKVADLRSHASRWPHFVPAAQNVGIKSVHALPMRLPERMLGTLGLFGIAVGALNDDDLSLGQALADVASVAIIAGNDATDRDNLNQQLQTALDSRVFIEQAKGVLAQHGNLEMADAFALLRGYARDHNLRLSDVARDVASRSLSAQQVIDRITPGSTHRPGPTPSP